MIRKSGIVPNILFTPHALQQARDADVIKVIRDHDACNELASAPGLPVEHMPNQYTKIVFYTERDHQYSTAHPDTPYIPMSELSKDRLRKIVIKQTIEQQQRRKGFHLYNVQSSPEMWNNTSLLSFALMAEVFDRAVKTEVQQQSRFLRVVRSLGSALLPLRSAEEVVTAKYSPHYRKAAEFLPYVFKYRTDTANNSY